VLTGIEIAITVSLLIPTAWALYDILRTPTESWTRSDQNQGMWVVLALLIPLVGPALYVVVARPRLRPRE